MSRRRSLSRDALGDVLPQLDDHNALTIPAPRHEREHRLDPWAPLPGAVEQPHYPTSARAPAVPDDAAVRRSRYDRYLDSLVATHGDAVAALAAVYDLTEKEVGLRYTELLADVRAEAGTSRMADLLESQDLSKAARLRVLRNHVFSGAPAASLKALDMLAEMEGTGHDVEASYEQYVRAVIAEAAAS